MLRADAALDAQSAGRKHEGHAIGLRFQAHRPHRADQAKRHVDDVTAGRQHDVRGRAALLADQLERAGVVGLVGEHPPHQPAIDDRQILAVARRQRQHPLSWNCGALAAQPAGSLRSTVARWWAGSVARRGIVPVPDGGARFMAGAVWTSGTAAGGTGGGRSENIWAETGAGSSAASAKASTRQAPAPGKAIRPARIQRYRYRPRSWPCFSPKTRQIQASGAEVRPAPVAEPAPAPNVNAAVVVQSHSLPRPLSPGINHAGGSEWTVLALPRRGEYR